MILDIPDENLEKQKKSTLYIMESSSMIVANKMLLGMQVCVNKL